MEKRRRKPKESGLTLLELIVVLALSSIIGAAAMISIHQIVTSSKFSSDMNTAINQIRNAEHWITRDARAARSINTSVGGNVLVSLQWESWDGSANHTATYTLVDTGGSLKELERDYDGSTTFVASYIDPAGTGADWDPNEHLLTVNVTARVGQETESRTFEVKPRPE